MSGQSTLDLELTEAGTVEEYRAGFRTGHRVRARGKELTDDPAAPRVFWTVLVTRYTPAEDLRVLPRGARVRLTGTAARKARTFSATKLEVLP